MTIDELISRFGEKHRNMVVAAIKFLDEHEPKWKLNKPVNRVKFIRDLISHLPKRDR